MKMCVTFFLFLCNGFLAYLNYSQEYGPCTGSPSDKLNWCSIYVQFLKKYVAAKVAIAALRDVIHVTSLISKFCMEEWQDIWSCCTGNKLHSIYPIVGSVCHNKFLCHHDTVIINRLRIGHTRLTHSCLLSGDDQPTCNTCGLPLTVYHILLECFNLNVIRQTDRDISLSTLSKIYSKMLIVVS